MSDALQNINLDQLTRSALGGADTSWVKPTIDKLQKTEADKEAAGDPIREQTAKDAKADKAIVDKRYAGIEPVDIPKWDAEKEAAKVRTDPLQAFGSAASIFAIAASAFTHTPITNALNGSAAAMQAIKKGDEEGYQRNYDAWKENTKIALERHNAQHEDYQDAIEKMKTDMATGAAMLTAATAKYGDRATALMNEAGLMEKLGSLQESRANAARAMLQALPQLEEKNMTVQSAFALTSARKKLEEATQSGDPAKIAAAQVGLNNAQQHVKDLHEALNPYSASSSASGLNAMKIQQIEDLTKEFTERVGRPPNAEEKLGIMARVNKPTQTTDLDDDSVKYAAGIFRRTGQMPALGMGQSAAQARGKIIKEAARQAAAEGGDVGGDLVGRADLKADTSSLTKLTGMRDSAISFENTALKNMDIAESLMDKGAGTEAGPVINRWLQAGKKATGDPDVAAFDFAIKTAANEVAKINSGATGSQAATEGARAEALHAMSDFFSPDQLRAVFKVSRMDMENRKEALDFQRAEIEKRIRGASKAPAEDQQHAPGSVVTGKDGKRYRIIKYDEKNPSNSDVELVQ